MREFSERFRDTLLEKRSATEGHAILSKKEVHQLCAVCNGFLPLPLANKVTPVFSGDEFGKVDNNVDLLKEREHDGVIRYFIQNTSKAVLVEKLRDYVDEYGPNGDCCNLDFSNVEDLVSKLQSMSAEDHYELVRAIALFWANSDDLAKYIA